MEKSRLINRRIALPAAVVVATLAGSSCGSKSNADTQKHFKKTPATAPQPATPKKESTVVNKSKDSSRIGYDVSYPNGDNLPKPGAFAIVGLNGENAITFNPYFKAQIAWANKSKGNTSQPKVAVYVHTDNPLAYKPRVADYPTSGKNINGTCNGNNSLACAYQYGENTAKNDVAHATGSRVKMVWLDVEGTEDGYTWENSKTANATVLAGMTAGFEHVGDKVGVYSGESDWSRTIGDIPMQSDLEGLPDWILGATNLEDAEVNCHAPRFTGKIVLSQIAGQTLDRDISCS